MGKEFKEINESKDNQAKKEYPTGIVVFFSLVAIFILSSIFVARAFNSPKAKLPGITEQIIKESIEAQKGRVVLVGEMSVSVDPKRRSEFLKIKKVSNKMGLGGFAPRDCYGIRYEFTVKYKEDCLKAKSNSLFSSSNLPDTLSSSDVKLILEDKNVIRRASRAAAITSFYTKVKSGTMEKFSGVITYESWESGTWKGPQNKVYRF